MNDELEREGDAEEQSGVVNERERERARDRLKYGQQTIMFSIMKTLTFSLVGLGLGPP